MTAGVCTLSSSKRDEVIRAACRGGEALNILVGRDGCVVKHASRFLRALITDDGPQLVVEMPAENGAVVAYREGDELDVLFHVGGERYAFSTVVKGRCVHSLNDGTKTRALVLIYPVEIENRQRRAHYRVALSTSSPVSIAFAEIPAAGSLAEMPEIHSGFIVDVSAGGVAMLCRQRVPAGTKVGTCLSLSFQLPGEPDHMSLNGVVRNVRKSDTREACILGVEYVVDEDDTGAARQVGLIRRFVVKRQREVLAGLRRL